MAGDMSNLHDNPRDFNPQYVVLLFILLKNSQYLSQKESNMLSQRGTKALLQET